MRNFLAFVGVVAIVLTVGGCWALTSFLGDVNQVPVLIETSLATIEAAGSVDNTVRLVDVQGAADPSGEVVLERLQAGQDVVVMATPQPPTPTAEFAPTPAFSAQFLADCALAQNTGRRVHPNCPTNAAEMLGPGR